MRLLSLPLLALLACSSPEASPTDAGGSDAADAGQVKDVVQPDTYEEPAPVCNVSGTATDENDVAWGLAQLQVCSTALCTLGTAAADGTFTVGVPCNTHYHVLAQPPSADPKHTSDGIGVLPGDIAMDFKLTTPVRIPETGAPIALTGGPQTVTVATGLSLTTDSADLNFSGTAQVAGVLIPSAKWPPFPFPGDAGTPTVLAMWALLPFGTTTKAGDGGSRTIAITVDNTFSLATSATVSFYQVNETNAQLMPNPSTGTVQSNGKITGGTVTRVTWIVMTSP